MEEHSKSIGLRANARPNRRDNSVADILAPKITRRGGSQRTDLPPEQLQGGLAVDLDHRLSPKQVVELSLRFIGDWLSEAQSLDETWWVRCWFLRTMLAGSKSWLRIQGRKRFIVHALDILIQFEGHGVDRKETARYLHQTCFEVWQTVSNPREHGGRNHYRIDEWLPVLTEQTAPEYDDWSRSHRYESYARGYDDAGTLRGNDPNHWILVTLRDYITREFVLESLTQAWDWIDKVHLRALVS